MTNSPVQLIPVVPEELAVAKVPSHQAEVVKDQSNQQVSFLAYLLWTTRSKITLLYITNVLVVNDKIALLFSVFLNTFWNN